MIKNELLYNIFEIIKKKLSRGFNCNFAFENTRISKFKVKILKSFFRCDSKKINKELLIETSKNDTTLAYTLINFK